MQDLEQDFFSSLSPSSSSSEGQLAVDVMETTDAVIVRSAVAGVEADDLDIHVEPEKLTIRGRREECSQEEGTVSHVEECFWGAFSRTISLPSPVDPTRTDAELQNGILTVRLQKQSEGADISVEDVGDL
ncbi:Hsp20/alpha crystallin family protein [Candidatus Uhrbacteria bacterium]|nr:Hsp20/alpha crystallin family protein [Candidatus Uhrbacteria bacterium]